jgi:hypothetical protein
MTRWPQSGIAVSDRGSASNYDVLGNIMFDNHTKLASASSLNYRKPVFHKEEWHDFTIVIVCCLFDQYSFS